MLVEKLAWSIETIKAAEKAPAMQRRETGLSKYHVGLGHLAIISP